MKMLQLCLILSVAAVLALPHGLRAEDQKPTAEKRERPAGAASRPMLNPEERLKALTEKLSLTPEQQEKVKAIYAKNVETLKTMRENKALSEDAKREKFTEMRRSEMQEINAMLTPEQQEKMKTLFRERVGAARADRPADQRPAQKPEAK